MAEAPSYGYYKTFYRGSAVDMNAFEACSAEAGARLRAVTGRRSEDVPMRVEDDWRCAWCALVDRVVGAGTDGTVASETVGSTSVTYAQDAQMSREEADLRAVLPWLSGTGLLCQAL